MTEQEEFEFRHRLEQEQAAQDAVGQAQGYKEPPPVSQRPKVEELSLVEKGLSALPSWLLSGNRQLRGIAQGAADQSIGAAQLAANAIGQGEGINKFIAGKEAEYQAQRGGDKGVDWYRGAGNVISPLNLLAAAKLPAATKLVGRMLQGAGLGAISSLTAPVTEEGDYWGEKGTQTALGTGFGAAIPVGAAGIGRVISPKGSPDVKLLNDAGIRTTVGERLGGGFKALEDFFAGVPIVGAAINAARNGGIKDVNTAMYNRILGHIDEKIPKDLKVGHEAMNYVHKKASDAYESAVNSEGILKPDAYLPKLESLQGKIAKLPEDYAAAFKTVADDAMSFADEAGNMTVKAADGAMRTFQEAASSLKNATAQRDITLRKTFEDAEKSLFNALKDNNPEVFKKLSTAKSMWHDYAILRDAASSAGARADGVVTPSQLLSSVASTAKMLEGQATGKGQISGGSAHLQDLAGAANRVLSSNSPRLNGAERTLVGMGAAGLGATFMPKALAIAGAASLPYLPGGRQVAGAMLSPRPWAEPAAEGLRRVSPLMAASVPALRSGE